MVCASLFMTHALMVLSSSNAVVLASTVVSGVSYSLLGSVLEPWFVTQAHRLHAPEVWIARLFAIQVRR